MLFKIACLISVLMTCCFSKDKGILYQKIDSRNSYLGEEDSISKYIDLIEKKIELKREKTNLVQKLEYDGLSIVWRDIQDSSNSVEVTTTGKHWKVLYENERLYLEYYVWTVNWDKNDKDGVDIWIKLRVLKSGKIYSAYKEK